MKPLNHVKKLLIVKTAVLLILFAFLAGNQLQAQERQPARLERLNYSINTDTADITSLDIEAITFGLEFKLTDINYLETSLRYDNDDLDLQGTWLIDFTEDTPHDMRLRLNLSSEDGLDSFEPALGVGGRFPREGREHYFFGHLDYYFDVSSSSLVYNGGVGYPLTYNSNIKLSIGNAFWDRDDHQLNFGMEIEF
ncbi:hypothetical protein [Halarsenatibacter silvermanii]|uniref:Outer membrane protein beta-barrel domain-containing protein n=1 Tax=Halarsenatibacter silvermanii TaxID=321763 RepID=A0A1G9ML55_9FIRM|nr:hypothetical protein [Halarsenatibacter silvermanii]SDL75016.1 hypothetical protein SAMN04488692_108103 [Halarsenatibacter silvermanii]